MDTNEAAEFIQRIVREQGPITGAKLSALLKEQDSEWAPTAHGSRTLGAFIAAAVTGVQMVGRAGLDPVYGVAGSSTESKATHEPTELWRVWVSPNSPYVLEVKKSDGQVSAVPKSGAARSDWVRIEVPGVEMHRQLARDFIRLQFPAGDEHLASLIDDKPSWWQSWLKEIRRRSLSGVWGSFRVNRLLSEFEAAMDRNAQIAPLAMGAAVSTMKAALSPATDVPAALRNSSDGVSKTELRRVIATVVNRMDEQELRQLRLPIGLVLDALKNPR